MIADTRRINEYFATLMDNAACACQRRELLEDPHIREAIFNNVYMPVIEQLQRAHRALPAHKLSPLEG